MERTLLVRVLHHPRGHGPRDYDDRPGLQVRGLPQEVRVSVQRRARGGLVDSALFGRSVLGLRDDGLAREVRDRG